MKELKAKPKVTQAMTRDGLTLENQATGEVENISSREAEQDYTPEAGGTAEKLLERADDAHDRHKAKKSAKQAATTAAEGDAALHRPSSRLQLTEEERADPDLQPYIRKADKKADKLDAARGAIPKKRVVVKETVYDEATGKIKSALRFEQQDKGPPKFKPNPAGRPVSEVLLFAHGKIHEVEHENVGVEGGHKGEELAERQTGRAIRSSIRHHKLKPYRAAEKAERQALAANAECFYQKSLRDNPEIAQAATNPVSRFWQKQQIKRQYAKAARTAGQTAGTAAQGAAKTAASSTRAAKAAAEESKRAASFVARHWKGSLAVLVLGLLLLMVLTGLQSCTAMFGSAGSGIAASSYFSEDSDMLAAEDAYAQMEAELQAYHEYYAQDESWKNHVIAETGLEGWEQDKAERDMLLGEFVPYMKLHCNLSHMEQEAGRALRSGEELTPEQEAYFHAVLEYVQECRPLLNQGQYRLPEPPKLSDFDQTLQDYKEQVQAEIAQEAAAASMTVEEYAAAGYEAPEQDSFSIYQIKSGDETREYRFEPYDRLQAMGRSVDRANYDLVYTAPLDGKTTLEDIYRTFNIDHPADFKGHSLSVSDVVVLHQGGKDTAHYCDSFGFQQVPEFLRENPLRTAELSTEQNENMIDGIINNTPSMGELEAKVKAGEQISLTDLADAAKAEAKKPKAKQSRKTQQKKPSIRAQLKAAQEEQAKKKPAREKSQELEV